MLRALLLAFSLVPVLAACTTGDDEPYDRGAPHGGVVGDADDAEIDEPGPGPGPTRKPRDVLDGTVSIEAKEVMPAARKIKAHAAKLKAELIEEEQDGNRRTKHSLYSSRMRFAVPAAEARGFVQWLSKEFEVTHTRIVFGAGGGEGGGGGAPKKPYVKIEVNVYAEWEDYDDEGRAWLRIGGRFVGAQVKPQDQPGGFRHGNGVVLMTPRHQEFSLTVDVFEKDLEKEQPVLVTLGGSGYSTYLGGGRRSWLNPTLGVHAGYASFGDRGSFVLDGQAGLEILRLEYGLLDAFARGMVLMNKDGSSIGRLYGVQLLFPF